MKNPFSHDTTIGERRGLLVLLVILLITIGIAAIVQHTRVIESSDPVVTNATLNVINNDTSTTVDAGNTSKPAKKSRLRKDSLKKSRKSVPVPSRNPRDERVD